MMNANMEKHQKDFILINQIQSIRAKNNELWMNILRLAMRLNAEETKKILHEITANDEQISYLMEKMVTPL
jgi:hypothetical protein